MKIKDVDFPEPLLNALRDGRLVVFAGAGVSMGPPAGLPSFHCLAKEIANGTGQHIKSSETEDQFLGRLEEIPGFQVHQLATDVLQRNNPQSNALHRNLLRLFKKTGPVRIVTTNFDCLFEQASKAGDLFQNQPKVFEAPALPPGSRFQGIVHLHGSVNEPEEMVLTHRDFGRAYLTEEDGWARGFLVSLFAKHDVLVLFVGYSHSDTIMTYLTPSLPLDGTERRFAFVGSANGDRDHNHWRRMGIKPVVFPQENKHDFAGLDTGVKGLADFGRRGSLGWQQEIARIAAEEPPTVLNDEASDTINHALTSVELTRFFINAVRSPSWINWLGQQGHLKRLFSEGTLEDQDIVLCEWLARQFRGEISSKLFSVISQYNGKLNSYLWKELVLQLGYAQNEPLDSKILSRWIHILMNCVPIQNIDEHHYSLLGLAEHCAKAEAVQCLLQVYDAITASLVRFLLIDEQDICNSWRENYRWRKLWAEFFPHIAHTLLERTTMRIEQRHSARIAWSEDNQTDLDNISRSAIESHEQDQRFYKKIDPLIDVARDCLEWLATHDRFAAKSWCDRFAKADAPLLRRLAVHATDARQDLSADDKVVWLLERCDVNETEARHEIFRMARNIYQELSPQKREDLIQAISNYELPENISTYRNEQLAYHRFNWFCWLQTDLNCELLTKELNQIRVQYPEFQPRQYPDLPHGYSMNFTTQSPWSVEKLLAQPASERLSSLLSYQPSQEEQILSMQSRHSLLLAVRQAAKDKTAWGLDLADAMAEKAQWETDLWEWIIYAWEEADLDQGSTRRVLSHLSKDELHHQRNARAITGFLNKFIQKTDAKDLTQWLDMLHKIAFDIHLHAVTVEDESREDPQDRDWFQEAINHPSGKLAEFWIYSINHWRKQQVVPPQTLNPEHRWALDTIIQDNGTPGKLGRTILVSEFDFLYNVDSVWAEQYLLPLFGAEHGDFSCAWDGFTFLRSLSPQLLELLQDKLIGALQRGIREFPQDTLERFVQLYVFALSQLIRDANDYWISEFFKYAQENVEIKHKFAVQIRNQLRNLDESQQQEWWNVWLKDYWKNRLQGVPCPLEDREIAEMLEWVIHLQGVLPEAVAMAVQMQQVTLEDHSNLLYQINESNLIDHYPNELAQLLIHLGNQERLPSLWKSDRNVIEKLLQKNLPENLVQELRELIARLQ